MPKIDNLDKHECEDGVDAPLHLYIGAYPYYQALFRMLAAVQYACTLNKYGCARNLRQEYRVRACTHSKGRNIEYGTRTLATAINVCRQSPTNYHILKTKVQNQISQIDIILQ